MLDTKKKTPKKCSIAMAINEGNLMKTESDYFTLDLLQIGDTGVVHHLQGDIDELKNMMALGFFKDTKIEALCKSPSGNPTAYLVRGVVLAIRTEDAKKIYLVL